MKTRRSSTLMLWCRATLLITTACAGPRVREGLTPEIAGELRLLRAATERFRVLDSAVAAGYASNVADCLVHEHHGAMGFHHVNRRYADARVEVERPEILLYERLPDGRYRLNGVEFVVPYTAWPRDSVAPALMGQKLKHEDNLKIWYLHVWAWTRNPNGLFADFHPDVACPQDSRKIFRPSGDTPALMRGNDAARPRNRIRRVR